jgi:hypothetical protein
LRAVAQRAVVASGDGREFVGLAVGGDGDRSPIGLFREDCRVLQCGDINAASLVRSEA